MITKVEIYMVSYRIISYREGAGLLSAPDLYGT